MRGGDTIDKLGASDEGEKMDSQFDELTTEAELQGVLRSSERAPELLYLHDPYCGISTTARAEVAQVGVRVSWIDVHARHDLGMEVERITGTRHESPQALVLRGRQASWSASHRKVTAAAILAAFEAAEEPDGASPAPRPGRWPALRRVLLGRRRPSTEP